MRQLIKYLFLVCTTLFVGCTSDDISEASLTIEATNSKISIDENESTQFVVKFGADDVTNEATIINITDGAYEVLEQESFSTMRPGTYKFIATYKEHTTKTPTQVSAYAGEGLSGDYYRRNVIFKFTGTNCTYCPSMSEVIHILQDENPDRYIEVAVHDGDQLTQNWTSPFKTKFGIQGLPTVVIDTNKELTSGKPLKPQIASLLETSNEKNPTVCGLKMATKEEDGKITVDVTANVLADNKYKLSVVLLVNGYQYEQSGTTDPTFKQSHVLTDHFQENVEGEDLGALVTNETIERQYTLNVPKDITSDRIEIVAYIQNQVSPGVYNTNNAILCPLGDSIDYQFEKM